MNINLVRVKVRIEKKLFDLTSIWYCNLPPLNYYNTINLSQNALISKLILTLFLRKSRFPLCYLIAEEKSAHFWISNSDISLTKYFIFIGILFFILSACTQNREKEFSNQPEFNLSRKKVNIQCKPIVSQCTTVHWECTTVFIMLIKITLLLLYEKNVYFPYIYL